MLKKGGVLRENCKVFSPKGTEIGLVTSGCFSPVLKKGIGMGFIRTKFRKQGTPVKIDIRGRKVDATVSKLPFVPQRYYRGEN